MSGVPSPGQETRRYVRGTEPRSGDKTVCQGYRAQVRRQDGMSGVPSPGQETRRYVHGLSLIGIDITLGCSVDKLINVTIPW